MFAETNVSKTIPAISGENLVGGMRLSRSYPKTQKIIAQFTNDHEFRTLEQDQTSPGELGSIVCHGSFTNHISNVFANVIVCRIIWKRMD
jgi:hypothetical protein